MSFSLSRTRGLVGGERFELPVSNESGFTVRAASNYRLPSHAPNTLFYNYPRESNNLTYDEGVALVLGAVVL